MRVKVAAVVHAVDDTSAQPAVTLDAEADGVQAEGIGVVAKLADRPAHHLVATHDAEGHSMSFFAHDVAYTVSRYPPTAPASAICSSRDSCMISLSSVRTAFNASGR